MKSSGSYFAIYKPFGFVSQFTREGGHLSLADLGFDFPTDVYPVGRLDADSEGLLLLTNERSLTNQLLHPDAEKEKEYWAQVEGVADKERLNRLSEGPLITVNQKAYKTFPCKVRLFDSPPVVPDRNPPVRFRKTVPDGWLSITLVEGKNRQVRKMTAAVGLPTLRLIRVRIGSLELPEWTPGAVASLSRQEFMRSIRPK